jgi:hypothetical protein
MLTFTTQIEEKTNWTSYLHRNNQNVLLNGTINYTGVADDNIITTLYRRETENG